MQAKDTGTAYEPYRTFASFLSGAPGPVVFVGIGNQDRGDDGAGPALIERIARSAFLTLNCGTVPENYLSKITALRAATIIIVDGADLGRLPGSWALLPAELARGGSLSTHTLSLGMMIDFIRAQYPAQIFVLCVQPASLAYGTALSETVRATLDQLAHIINETNAN